MRANGNGRHIYATHRLPSDGEFFCRDVLATNGYVFRLDHRLRAMYRALDNYTAVRLRRWLRIKHRLIYHSYSPGPKDWKWRGVGWIECAPPAAVVDTLRVECGERVGRTRLCGESLVTLGR